MAPQQSTNSTGDSIGLDGSRQSPSGPPAPPGDVAPYHTLSPITPQDGIIPTRVMSPRVLDAIQAFTPNAVATAGGPAAPGSPPPYTFSPLRLGGQGTECDICGHHAVHLWTCASCHTQGHEQCLLPQLIAGFPFCGQCAPIAHAAYERHTHATRQRWQTLVDGG